jgi:hypothetical protein
MEDRIKKISKKDGKEIAAHLEACWRAIGGIILRIRLDFIIV